MHVWMCPELQPLVMECCSSHGDSLFQWWMMEISILEVWWSVPQNMPSWRYFIASCLRPCRRRWSCRRLSFINQFLCMFEPLQQRLPPMRHQARITPHCYRRLNPTSSGIVLRYLHPETVPALYFLFLSCPLMKHLTHSNWNYYNLKPCLWGFAPSCSLYSLLIHWLLMEMT